MKVYVLIEDWASDDDNGASVVGVYSTEELAVKKMNKVIKELKENGCLFETIVKGECHFDSYTDGEWAKEHECLYIEPVIIDEDLK